MNKETIEKMKEIIAEKKQKSAQQGNRKTEPNKAGSGSNKPFKTTKRGGSITK